MNESLVHLIMRLDIFRNLDPKTSKKTGKMLLQSRKTGTERKANRDIIEYDIDD